MQTYSAAEVDLVLEWIDKYFQVNALINKVFGSGNSKNHSSIRKNHYKFVPIWIEFCVSHGYSIEFTDNSGEMDYRNNPFLFYYDQDNLLDLAEMMEIMMPLDTQNSNNQTTEPVLNIVNSFSSTVVHLAYWIGEFADTSVQFP
jgi:hypothetical protein